MLQFPAIMPPSYALEERHQDHTIKGQTDNVTILTRPRFTKMLKTFVVSWRALPVADMNKLRVFFETKTYGGAVEFIWTYPNDGGTYANKRFKVRFEEDLVFSLTQFGRYEGNIKLTGTEV